MESLDSTADAQIFWDHPVLGKGRPGWHIECSAINYLAFKGQPTTIHTGGVDLIFPHHTNEIAQSQPIYRPFVNYWYHNEHLLVDGGRMGKRFNNFYTITGLKAKGYSGQDLRYFYLGSSFTSQQNFTFEALAAARVAREKLFKSGQNEPQNTQAFQAALNDNLNAPQALAAVWAGNATREQIESVLGFKPEQELVIPKEIQNLLAERAEAKQQKDFKKSDDVRLRIERLGYEIMDTPEGQKVKKKTQI